MYCYASFSLWHNPPFGAISLLQLPPPFRMAHFTSAHVPNTTMGRGSTKPTRTHFASVMVMPWENEPASPASGEEYSSLHTCAMRRPAPCRHCRLISAGRPRREEKKNLPPRR